VRDRARRAIPLPAGCRAAARRGQSDVRCFTNRPPAAAEKWRREEVIVRYGLLALGALVLGTAIWIGLHRGLLAGSAAVLDETARLAIEIRCQGREGRDGRECVALLRKLYLAGSLDPEKTLRDYCTPSKTQAWGGRRRPPPALCVERYGGWQEG